MPRVAITPVNTGRGFAEPPPNTFAPSDRKFLAVAVIAEAAILNATDSDWAVGQARLDEVGVVVEQICPGYAERVDV